MPPRFWVDKDKHDAATQKCKGSYSEGACNPCHPAYLSLGFNKETTFCYEDADCNQGDGDCKWVNFVLGGTIHACFLGNHAS